MKSKIKAEYGIDVSENIQIKYDDITETFLKNIAINIKLVFFFY